MPMYICDTDCFWNGKRWYIGDRYFAQPGEDVPHHFFLEAPEVKEVKAEVKKGGHK